MHFFYIVLSLNLSRWFCRHSDFAPRTCNLLCHCGSLSESFLCLCLSCFILFLPCYVARSGAGLMLHSLLVWWPCVVFVYPNCVWGCRCPVAQALEYVALSPVCLASAQSLMGLKEGERKPARQGERSRRLWGDERSRALAALVWGSRALGRLTRAAGGTVGMGTGRLAHHEMRARVHPSHTNQDEERPTIRVKKGMAWFNFHSSE